MNQAALDRILDKYTTDVQSIFPQIRLNSGGYGMDFHVGTSGMNRALRDSEYFVDPVGHEYFHLTTYRSLFSVINSGKLRLYNLRNSDDPNELNYFREIGFSQGQIDYFKDHTFVLSGCHIDDLNNSGLWQSYGKVAIVYEFLDSSMGWDNFFFAGIQYKTNPAFARFGELLNQYREEYGNVPFNYDTLPNLVAYHKAESFAWEKEVRLMYIPSITPKFEEFADFKTSTHHTGYTKYIELPLFIESSKNMMRWMQQKLIKHFLADRFFDDTPRIKIKRIVFGDNEKYIDQHKYDKIKSDFQNAFQMKFGYRIQINSILFPTAGK